MNRQYALFIAFLAVSLTVSGCGPSPERVATMTAAVWTATPTATPTPTVGTVFESFEGTISSRWTINDENQAQLSTEFAHEGKRSLKVTHTTSKRIFRLPLI